MEYLKSGIIVIKDDSMNSEDPDLEKFFKGASIFPKVSPETPLVEDVEVSFASDEEEAVKLIWKRLKKGDSDALGDLYDLYIDELFSYGMEKVYNKTRVMDAIHDLFVDLYKYRSNLSTPTNVKYYLFKSLKRKVYRSQSPKQNISLGDSLETMDINADLSSEAKIIEAELYDEKSIKLKTAFSFLTVRQQKVIHLRYSENLPYEEIAMALNISIASSRTLVYRALSVLRENYVSLILMSLNLFI